MELNHKTAVITGGASGIGRAVAIRLHRQGVKVTMLDLNEEKGAELVRELGQNASFFAVDVSDDESVRAAVAETTDRFGDIHICCNCAGVVMLKRTIDRDGTMPLSSFQKSIDINLLGTFNVSRLCAERMSKNAVIDNHGGRGCIINVASVAAFQGPAGTVAYSAAKAAIVGMTLPLARDLAPFGIRVNAIAPGLILTPMSYGHDESKRDEAEKLASQSLQNVLYPQRFGTVEEVAHLTQFIIENDYINAECIRIDGGKRI